MHALIYHALLLLVKTLTRTLTHSLRQFSDHLLDLDGNLKFGKFRVGEEVC